MRQILSDRSACRLLVAGLTMLLVLSLPGCSPSGRQQGTVDDQQTSALINAYYRALQAGDIAQATAFYPDDQHLKWQALLEQRRTDYGALISYQVKGVEINTVYSGRLYVVRISVHNELKDSFELVTLFKGLDGGDYTIQSHTIKTLVNK
ncbi:MAG: hypothetical protein HY940_02340 [Gammaproteobacteria bacterium]|nr:hypothetical protein [Gammaproteobacteria bacterium]